MGLNLFEKPWKYFINKKCTSIVKGENININRVVVVVVVIVGRRKMISFLFFDIW